MLWNYKPVTSNYCYSTQVWGLSRDFCVTGIYDTFYTRQIYATSTVYSPLRIILTMTTNPSQAELYDQYVYLLFLSTQFVSPNPTHRVRKPPKGILLPNYLVEMLQENTKRSLEVFGRHLPFRHTRLPCGVQISRFNTNTA